MKFDLIYENIIGLHETAKCQVCDNNIVNPGNDLNMRIDDLNIQHICLYCANKLAKENLSKDIQVKGLDGQLLFCKTGNHLVNNKEIDYDDNGDFICRDCQAYNFQQED